MRQAFVRSHIYVAAIVAFSAAFGLFPSHVFASTQIFLSATSTIPWTVPDDWNSASNTIEVIGAGGGSQYLTSDGGGGGAYSKISNLTLTPGNSVSYQVGDGTALATTTTARDTWFSSTGTVLAKGGTKGGTGVTGTGGVAASGVGTVKYSGGSGYSYESGGGDHVGGAGGGAAGPNGDGEDAIPLANPTIAGSCGGTGDAGYGGTTIYDPGGFDDYACTGGAGVAGTEWGSYGSGSGADGYEGGDPNPNSGGLYGGGASGNGASGPFGGNGVGFSSGAGGLIVITYDPAAPTCTLTASRTLIPSGAAISLTWTISGSATSASIDNSIGSVSTADGATTTTPTATSTTYTLTVSNAGGSNTCSSSAVNLDGDKIVFLTTATTSPWTVPSDWNNASNTIEAIGSGHAGNSGGFCGAAQCGGGGGAYAAISNLSLTSGGGVTYQVGASGDTYFNGTGSTCSSQSVCAAGSTNTFGGQVASSVGTTRYQGGSGSSTGGGTHPTYGAGGGAAGPGGAGADSLGATGGAGDNGSGGAGGTTTGAGGNGLEWDALHGSGGGGGQSGDGGSYGGGAGYTKTAGPGLIVITYTPASTPGTPGTPTYSGTTATSTTVNWSAAAGASTYKVERCTNSGCSSYSQIASGVSGTSYNDSGTLTGNTTYGYRVRATNTYGDGSYSSGSEVTTLPDVPGTPSFSSTTSTGTTVSWSAPTGGASTYKVERCAGTGCSSFTQIASGVSGTSYNDTGTLSPNTTYRYHVRGTNAAGDGLYSAGAEVTTPPNAATCTLSANPGGVVSGGSSTLSWTTTDASSASIDNGIGSVSTGSGSTSVTPSATTLYTLTVSGTGGGGSCSATVSVSRSAATFFGGHVLINGSHIYIR